VLDKKFIKKIDSLRSKLKKLDPNHDSDSDSDSDSESDLDYDRKSTFFPKFPDLSFLNDIATNPIQKTTIPGQVIKNTKPVGPSKPKQPIAKCP
jgi:hypothetical protein